MTTAPFGLNVPLASINDSAFDVAVVGAGINGSATANELARQGYSVILVDRGDFGAGSSSRSSRIMHCGLNYLALAWSAGRFSQKATQLRLAQRMMQERAELRALHPELIVPRQFVIPIREGDGLHGWQLDAAFGLLWLLGGRRVPLHYHRESGKALDVSPLRQWFGPALRGLAFFDELVFEWPERVCVHHALDAACAGAAVRNYTEVAAVKRKDDGWRIHLRDTRDAACTAWIEARAIVNATGAQSDVVNSLCISGAPRTVTPNKGCHIAVRLPSAFRATGIICRNAIGHLFLAVPWKDFHILGPTETVTEEISDPRASESDVDAILREANSALPNLSLSRKDVLFQWAGLRPATFDPANPRGSWERKMHRLSPDGAPLLASMSWGRLADHRISAHEFARLVQRELGEPASKRAAATPARDATMGDLDAAVLAEGARSIADVLFRRTGWGWSSDLADARVEEVARKLSTHLGIPVPALIAEYREFLGKTFSRG